MDQDNQRHQTIVIQGNGNIIGNGNRGNHSGGNNNSGNNQPPRRPPPPRAPDNRQHNNTKDDALAMGLGMLAVAMMIGWQFVRHSQAVYGWIEVLALIAVVTAGLPVLWNLLAYQELGNDRQILLFAGAVALFLSIYILVEQGREMLDPAIIQTGWQAHNAIVFFKQLNAMQQVIVQKTGFGAIALGMATGSLILLALYAACVDFIEDNYGENWLYWKLQICRPQVTATAAVIMLMLAWLFQSEMVFTLLHP